MLAPISVFAFAIILLIVIVSSIGGGSSTTSMDRGKAQQQPASGAPASGGPSSSQRFYVVKPGDSLSTISDKTGVPVEKLQERNPSLDPQQLISGQRIKLR